MRVRILYQKDWKQEYSIQSFNHHWSPNMYLQCAMNLVVNQTPSSLPWSCQLDVEKQGKLPKEVHLCIHGVKHPSPWVLARALLLTDCVIKFLQASIEWGHSIRTIGCWLKFSKAFLLSLWSYHPECAWLHQRFPSFLCLPKEILFWMAVTSNAGICHLAAVLGRHQWET